MDDEGLAAPQPVEDGKTAAERRQRRVVGVRRTDNGQRESFIPRRGGQQRLGGDLVPGVGPIRIIQRRVLGDGQARRRLPVGGGRTDEHVLPNAAAKHSQIGGGVVGSEGNPVHNHVKRIAAQRFCDSRRVADIGRQDAGPRQPGPLVAVAAVDQRQVDALLEGQR